MNNKIYKISVLCFLGMGIMANAQTGKVGVNTDAPKETLDVKGTVKVQELPASDTGMIYNGLETKTTEFKATKTVVANDDGVLGVSPYILPKGSTASPALQWDDNQKQWVAAPITVGGGVVPTLEITKSEESNGFSGETNGILTFGNYTYDLKTLSPWKYVNVANFRGATGKYDKIYHDANVGIGNFSNKSVDLARLNIANETDNSKLLAFIHSGNVNNWIVGLTGTANMLFKTSTGGNRMLLTRGGNLHVGTSVTDNGGSGGFEYNGTTKFLGLGIGEAPTQSVDVAGTARLRGLSETGNKPSLLAADANGVVRKIAGTTAGQVLKYNGTTWEAGADTDTDTSLANANQMITQGQPRSVEVNGNNTTLTFSSTRNSDADKNVFNFKKNHETLAIKPNTDNEASYIGFHKSNANNGDFIGFVGRKGQNHDDITVAATTSTARVVLEGAAGVKISTFPTTGSKNALLATDTNDGIVRQITGTNGQVLKYTNGQWVAGTDTDTDTSLANANQDISAAGVDRQVTVSGNNATLTFSSTKSSNHVFNFKKDEETLAIKPSTDNQASYIGFHKRNAGNDRFTGYIGRAGNNHDDITVAAETSGAKVVLNGEAGVQIIRFPTTGSNNVLLAADANGVVRKIAGTANGQVLKYTNGQWVAGTDTDTDTSLANANQDISAAGVDRQVTVSGNNATLTFSSTKSSNHVFNFQKNEETLAIKPSTDNQASYIGFHKRNAGNDRFIGYIGRAGNNHDDITVAAETSGAKVVLNGEAGVQIIGFPTGSTNALLATGDNGIVRKITGTNGQVLTYTNGQWVAGNAPSSTATGGAWLKMQTTNTAVTLAENVAANSGAYFKGVVGVGGDFSDANMVATIPADQIETVKLAVKGAVYAGSYKGVNGATMFPDYVFQKYYTGTSSIKADYNFNTLSQVEQFVKQNGHLPGYKSAKTIKEQGYIDLMDTQITNVEKIEELYLHSIEQDKKLKEQAAEIAELKELVKQLLNKK